MGSRYDDVGASRAIFKRITVALRRSHEVMKVADVGASWQSRVVGVRGVPRRSPGYRPRIGVRGDVVSTVRRGRVWPPWRAVFIAMKLWLWG